MYRHLTDRYKGHALGRGSLSVGDASAALTEPVTAFLKTENLERGHNPASRRDTVVISADPQETADDVGIIVNALDSAALAEKAKKSKQPNYSGKQDSPGGYIGTSKARIPKGDRRALYGLPNGGD